MKSLKSARYRVNEGLYSSMGAMCAAFLFVSFFPRPLQSQIPNSTSGKAPEFEVASIRLIPEHDVVPLEGSPISPPGAGVFTMRQVTLALAIAWAFGIDQDRLSGGPDWLDRQCYEISAKPGGDVGLSYEQIRPLLQQLLQERFHLKYHHATKNEKGYALVAGKGGPKLAATKGGAAHGYLFRGSFDEVNAPVSALAGVLAHTLGEPVVDKTGIKGNFDFKLNYAPMEATDSTQPSIFTALDEQLGLRLEKQMVPVDIFVIDHVDKVPTGN